MSQDQDGAVAEDQPVVEEAASEEVQVELDKFTAIEGDLVDNPVIEEVEEPEEDGDKEEQPAADDDSGDDGDDADKAEPAEADKPDQPSDSPAAEELPETPAPAEPATELKAEDPGDFQPKADHSFEVTTIEGKTIKISTLAEADAFAERLDNEEGLLAASQFTKFTRGVAKMDIGLADELKQYESDKQAFEDRQATEKAQNDQIEQWSKEVKYLEAKGLIPKIDASKDGNWLANETDPAVAERLAIFKWMENENKARDDAGIARVTSAVDAFQMMKAEQAETSAKEEKTREGDSRRAKGSRVSGNAPYSPTNQPKDTIIGLGGSLNDLVHEAQMSM